MTAVGTVTTALLATFSLSAKLALLEATPTAIPLIAITKPPKI